MIWVVFERGQLRVEVAEDEGLVRISDATGTITVTADEARWLMWGGLSGAVAMIDRAERARRLPEPAVEPEQMSLEQPVEESEPLPLTVE